MNQIPNDNFSRPVWHWYAIAGGLGALLGVGVLMFALNKTTPSDQQTDPTVVKVTTQMTAQAATTKTPTTKENTDQPKDGPSANKPAVGEKPEGKKPGESSAKPTAGKPGGNKGRPSRPQPVIVAKVQQHSKSPTFRATGLLQPIGKAFLSVDVAGRVEAIHKRAGDKVKKGELLAKITNTDLTLNLEVTKAKLTEVQAELRRAQQSVKRIRTLYKRKLTSQEQFQNESASYEVTKARAKSVEAQVTKLQTQVNLMAVRAPMNGEVVQADLEVGQWVTPNKPIYEIYNYEQFELLASLPGRFLNQVAETGTVKIIVPEVSREFQGQIAGVVRHVSSTSGSFQVRLTLNTPGGASVSGLLGQVEVPLGNGEPALSVPRDALVRKNRGTTVVVVRDGKAVVVPVQVTGNLDAGSIIVQGKLNEGEDVVVRGNERIFPGTPVNITDSL